MAFRREGEFDNEKTNFDVILGKKPVFRQSVSNSFVLAL